MRDTGDYIVGSSSIPIISQLQGGRSTYEYFFKRTVQPLTGTHDENALCKRQYVSLGFRAQSLGFACAQKGLGCISPRPKSEQGLPADPSQTSVPKKRLLSRDLSPSGVSLNHNCLT